MKTYLWRIWFAVCIVAVMIAIRAPMPVYAACQIVGTTVDGYIVVCDGPDTIGINSGDGSDIITIITGAQVTKTDSQSLEAIATASATAVNAGNGNNQITNQGSVSANAGATASLKVDTPSQATARATAIKTGSGVDVVENTSTITSTATSTSQSGGTNATSEATAIGIDAGDSSDTITNNSAITPTSTATASSNGVTLTGIGIGTYASPTGATATSKGIEAGNGSDTINNTKDVATGATSTAEALNVSIGLFQYEAKTYGDASTKAIANATGVFGAEGDDQVTNAATGTMTATSMATASTNNVSVEIVGGVKSNSSTTAYAFSSGVDGGNGKDTITNSGTLTVKALSEVDAVGVDVKFLGIPTKIAEWFGAKLGDAKTGAQSTAKGIDGGEGDDTITNSGTIDAYAKAEADSADVATSVAITTLGGGATPQAPVSSGNLQISSVAGAADAAAETPSVGTENTGEGNEITDVGTIARTYATGINGGAGKDAITNNYKIFVKAESEADSVSLNPSISFSKGGWMNILPGTALTNATTTAQSTATGMVGGAGNDTITNADELTSEAISNATSTSVSVLLKGVKEKGLAWGGTFADATTKAISTAMGIDGGEGNDTITNSGKIKATATPDALSTSIGVTLTAVEEGLTAGLAYVDATTTAEATATGIEGGIGNDTITSTGEIQATAQPTSTSVKVVATLSGAFSQEWSASIGGAIVDGRTKAISNAAGISGGDGDDAVMNSGTITVKSNPDVDSVSVTATLTGAGDGLTVGFTYVDGTTTAEANGVGIAGGAGNDTITNTSTGQIDITANPISTSVGVGVTLTGVTKGTGIVGGAALTDGTTKAISNVAGISGGEGSDTITNDGKITVNSNPGASSTNVSVTLGAALGELGLVGGLSYADATTTAEANAIGIEGDAGNDTITNTGAIHVTTQPSASSATVGLTAQGVKGMGAAVGISLTDGTTKAIASATGIAGGEGDDTITNSGTITVNALPDADSGSVSVTLSAAKEGVAAGGAFADATTTAQATSAGIGGGAGNDTLNNTGMIQVTADSESNSASVTVSAAGTMTGAVLGVTLSDGTIKAVSNAAGIKGDDGNDTIKNSYLTTVTSTADIDSASVTVNLGFAQTGLEAGVALADMTTRAESSATGLSGGSGNDTIENSMFLMTAATSTISSASVSVKAGVAVQGVAAGATFVDGETVATSSAIGLEGGTGNDTITNRGLNLVNATSDVTAASVGVTLEGTKAGLAAGASLVGGENRADALAIGMGGGIGNDTIFNYGPTLASATAVSTRTNVSVTGTFSLYGVALGASFADTTNTAQADARGIEGGEGNDQITNDSLLSAGATTTANTNSVSVSVNMAIFGIGAGASLASAETTASAVATGIDGDDGENTITNTNRGSISSISNAYADTTSVSVNLLGYVKASADSTAAATSVGMKGGKDKDSIQNDGTVTLSATSEIDASAYAVQLMGYGESSAKGTSNATVKGIVGGDGINTLINIGSITGTATANGDVSSYDIQLSGGGKATAGTEANAIATGIAGGKDMDTIRNQGTINLSAQSTLVSESRSFKIFGVGIADADSKASAFATGIDGAEGPNTLTNTGSITVSSNAGATTTGMTANIGVAAASASTTSNAHSLGITSGSGEDTITNEGILNVKATSNAYAGSGDLSFVGLSFGDSLTEAVADGINAGGGNDLITNKGTITVAAVQDNDHPMAYSNVESVSLSLSNFSMGALGSKAQATGIMGGRGNDTITNTGAITVGDDYWMAKGRAYGFSGQFFEFFSLTSIGATAETVSTGIEGGDGNDDILNDSSGVLTVKATSYAWTEGAADVTTFGSPAVFASSTTKATATGISGGKGNDEIENRGSIDVYAHAFADGSSDSWVGWGSPKADSTGDATATAVGINAGEGKNLVTNSKLMNVSALAETSPYAKADSDVDYTDSETTAYSRSTAVGILAGDDDNTVSNKATGKIFVTAAARTLDAQGNAATAVSDEEAKATVAPASVATGIQAGKGNNSIFNDGQMTVTSEVHANSHAWASSTLYTATATTKTGGSADATGIKVGDGNNTIKNNGTLTVTASNEGIALSDYPTAHLDNGYAYAGGGNTSLTSNATGISAGNGVNLIENHNSMTVSSAVNADARAYTNTATTTTYAEAYAGGNAKATGIFVGNGQNTIKNDGTMTVSATANAYALGSAEEYGSAYIGSESSPGIVAEAVGISTGHGINTITNYGAFGVNATATATAEAQGDQSTQTFANSYATATGIRTGNGANTVNNFGTMNVTANGLGASAVGIITGSSDDRVTVGTQGTLTVQSSAAATPGNINALATGIDAGNGNNHVENYGLIQVTTEAVRLFGDTQLQSFGIKTGSGNDLIINAGRISTENRVFDLLPFPPHWSSSPGIAISSGGGNDTIILMNGSGTTGHIDLGSGDDCLTLVGTPLVTGNVTGGVGIDTLVFQGAGSIGFTPMDFEQAVKQGAGTFTVANLPTTQRIEIKQGVLQVNNNYQFSNNGLFQTIVNGNGSFGQFKVNGNMQLAGDLSVLKGPGPYKNGTTYNIVEATGAQGINGTFGNTLLPQIKPLLRFGLNRLPNAVQVEVYAPSFTTVATNRVEWTTGNYLDRIMPAATGDLSNVLGEFQSLSTPQFALAFSSLSPDSYDNYTRATYDSMWQYTRSLQRRLANIRAYASAAGYEPESKPLLLAFAGSDASLGELLATGRISQTQSKNGLWFNGYGQWGNQEPDKGFTGFDYNTYGGTLGFDHAFNDKITAGLSLGYARTDVDLDHHQGDGTIKTFAGSLYGSYFTKNAFLEGAVSYGRNWYDNDRLIAIGPILRKASSDHEGDLFSAYLGGGYAFDVKNWAIGPFASLRYIYLSEESFQEKGADSLNLRVGHRNTDSLTSELGLRLARFFDIKYGSLIPEVSAAWSYDFDIDDRIITAAFDGSPGAAFSIAGQPVERNGAVLGAGLTFLHKSGFSTSLRYRGEFREKYQSHGVMGEFRLMF